jgi:hypothetical protein
MIIEVIDVHGRLSGKPEHDAPIPAYAHGIESLQITMKSMEPQTRQSHVARGRGYIKPGQNQAEPLCVIGAYSIRSSRTKEPLQSLVPE